MLIVVITLCSVLTEGGQEKEGQEGEEAPKVEEAPKEEKPEEAPTQESQPPAPVEVDENHPEVIAIVENAVKVMNH